MSVHIQTSITSGSPEPARTLFVFDIDGPLTNSKKVMACATRNRLQELVRAGHFLTFNTGRDMVWTRHQIIKPLVEGLTDTCLDRIFVVAEKGAHTLWHDGEKFCEWVDLATRPCLRIEQGIKSIVTDLPDFPCKFDDSKRAMLTWEYQARSRRSKESEFLLFQDQKYLVANRICEYISNLQETEWRVDVTGIAIDIEHLSLGKDLGAEKILQWLNGKCVHVDEVVSFGDSPSDLHMHTTFLKHLTLASPSLANASVLFVAVGDIDESRLTGVPAVSTEYAGMLSAGTLLYLDSIRNREEMG